MTDPVMIAGGHIFERRMIESWIAQRSPNVNHPMTGLPLADLTLTPQPQLQAEIRSYLATNPSMID
jgi:hypothetical protein